LTPDMAASIGLAEPKGAIVVSVVPDSPAAKAGFRVGDVITAINGKGIDDSHELTRRVAGLEAGKSASFAVMRDGASRSLNVTIAPKKDVQVASTDQPGTPGAAQGETGKAMGLGLAALTPDIRHTYNLDDNVQGVVVTKVDPDSDAADKGVQPGDVLLSVSNKAVHSPQDVEKSVAAAHSIGRKSVLLLVASGGISHFVAIDIGKA